MPSAMIDGIKVNYEAKGEGIPLVMRAPGGFDSTIDSWAKRGEQLMAIKHPTFIMSGDDASHSTSSAHPLRELVPGSVLSDLMPPRQDAETVKRWILDSVASGEAGRRSA